MIHDFPNIAFIGKMGAGKTTAAKLLGKYFDYQRLSIAEPIRVGAGSFSDRAVLQYIGTDVVRKAIPDFWLNIFCHYELGRLNENYEFPRIAVDDTRFPNEVTRLKVEDFLIVRIHANAPLRKLRLLANGKLQDEAQMYHESETALDGYLPDDFIVNEGTPGELLERLSKLLTRRQRW